MTQVSLSGQGLIYPASISRVTGVGSQKTIDAAGEKATVIGHVFINGRPASAKTLSAAGGGSISFRSQNVTFADTTTSPTSIDFGIQDVATGAGPAAQPDGTFDVYGTLVAGTDTITSNAWKTVTMETGTKDIAHGDLIAIVMDMTVRGGANTDSVQWATVNGDRALARPTSNQYLAGAWATTLTDNVPLAYITFDDGTLAAVTNYDSLYPGVPTSESFVDTTTPDERGMIFQVPWDCKIGGFLIFMNVSAAAADCTVKLYTDPTGTPAAVSGTTVSILGEQGVASNHGQWTLFLPSEVSLSKNTDYLLAVRSTGSSNTTLSAVTLPSETLRPFITNGTTFKKATRSDDTGAFTAENPAVTLYNMGIIISSFDDGTGAGSGGFPVLGGPFT